MKVVNVILGIALAVLCIFGLSRGVEAWLAVSDLLMAVISIVVAMLPARGTEQLRSPEAGIGMVLLGLGIAGLFAAATGWLVWSTFAFGIAYWITETSAVGVVHPMVGPPSHL